MNRTQKKQAKQAQARQMAAILEMRAMVHETARELFVARAAQEVVLEPAQLASACVELAIAFVDALNTYTPRAAAGAPPALVPPPVDANGSPVDEEQLDREGEGRELARDAIAELTHEPGSEEEMEARS